MPLINIHQFPLIIAANRDEFHARPTASSHFWEHHPDLLAGTDLQAGGTWLGVTRNGNIAGLTNIRAPGTDRSDAMTRGDLVINALLNQHSWTSHTQQLQASADQYNGFNFTLWEIGEIYRYLTVIPSAIMHWVKAYMDYQTHN